MGFIDVCPDQQYLAQKILPIYSKAQMGIIPARPLKTVSKEQVLEEQCPVPDWNYLRWDGYSDRKYQAILSGEGLLELEWYGEKIPLELQARSYYNGGALALLLVDWTTGEPEPWEDLTVNLGANMEKDCAFINVNHLGNGILPWIEQNGLGKPTGRIHRSGFVEYPEYRFNSERLQELDDYGYHMDAVAALEQCGIPREQLAEEKAALYQQLAEINREIRLARQKISMCKTIEQNRPQMERDIQVAENMAKEVERDEHRRR